MSSLSNKNPTNHELLTAVKKFMRVKKLGGIPDYTPPPNGSREERLIHFLRWTRQKFPRQACPLAYIAWVVDGNIKRLQDNSKNLLGLKSLINNKRVQDQLAKKNQRIFYVYGVGEDAGYRMNADDEDMALAVLSRDKRRVKTAMHKAAVTYNMIDEDKLRSPEARAEYGDVGSMVGLLKEAGFLTLPEMAPENVKRLEASVRRRSKRNAG